MASATALPRSLRVMAPRMATWNPPAGEFDRGTWELPYGIYLLVPNPPGTEIAVNRIGQLRLRREPQPGGAVLTVSETLNHARYVYRTQAALNLADDLLATPRSWLRQTWLLGPDGAQVPDSRTELAGNAGSRDRPCTCSWSLVAALHTAGVPTEPWRFDLLDELDKLKPDQRLEPAGEATVTTAAGAPRLRGCTQLGRGVLPTDWWLDDAGRVVAVIGAMRAYLLDTPGAAA